VELFAAPPSGKLSSYNREQATVASLSLQLAEAKRRAKEEEREKRKRKAEEQREMKEAAKQSKRPYNRKSTSSKSKKEDSSSSSACSSRKSLNFQGEASVSNSHEELEDSDFEASQALLEPDQDVSSLAPTTDEAQRAVIELANVLEMNEITYDTFDL